MSAPLLQAYIDDSKTYGDNRLFVLAGYLATADVWVQFSEEWRRFLGMNPRIEYFKLKEALGGHGEFDGREAKLCTERIVLMRGIVEKYEPAEFALGFFLDDYEEFASRIRIDDLRNPYYFASIMLTIEIAKQLNQLGFERQPIEFIFDEQTKEKAKFIRSWEFCRSMGEKYPGANGVIREGSAYQVPRFEDDKEVMPLQAADMHATVVRMSMVAAASGKPQPRIPGVSKRLRGMFLTWDRKQFRQQAEFDIAVMNNLRGMGIIGA